MLTRLSNKPNLEAGHDAGDNDSSLSVVSLINAVTIWFFP